MISFIFIRTLLANGKAPAGTLAAGCLIAMLAVSSLGIRLIEHEQDISLFDNCWLSIVTMTAVAYGDLCQRTTSAQKMERRGVCLQRTMNLR